MVEFFKVDTLEKLVFLNLFGPKLTPQTIFRLYFKKIPQQGPCLFREVLRDGDSLAGDISYNFVFVFGVKWRSSSKHVIQY